MPLGDIRKRIDAIDDQLLNLLSERADCVHEVGEVKKKEGLEIYAPEREEALLQKLIKKSSGKLPEESIRAIFREIMSASLHIEDHLKIAYLGPEGTWTHQAAIKKFGNSVEYLPQPNFAEVFDKVERRKASYGVVPIENSTEGAVSHTLDLFVNSNLKICAQVLLRIENGLMASIPKNKIKTLYSHPQVFGQCKNWILQHFPEADMVEVSSTTKAAQIARENADQGAAAMGGSLAAQLNQLTMLDECIQDSPTNTTRFLVIGERTCPPTGDDRTSILFSVKDQPGSLVSALKLFENFNVNMSKIESRPSKNKDWEYIFYVDLAGHCQTTEIAEALCNLESHCSIVKILGSYPNIKIS